MKELIVIFAFLVCADAVQTCSNNVRWPDDAINGYNSYSTADTFTGSGFLMEAVEYHTPDSCTCGVLYKWIFHAVEDGAIELQVWDHLDHQSYQLKGENYFTVPVSAKGETVEYLVPERDRITIRNNYLIGWYAAGPSGIVGYKEGVESYSDESRREPSMTNLDPAHEPTFDWSSGSSVVTRDRIYAFGAEVIANTAPEFTNLPREVWIYGDETAGAFIYKISADDIDSKDVSSLFIRDIDEQSTSQFYYDRTIRTVFLAVSKPAVGTYTMTFEVQDPSDF
ncbi:uncharacterized protein LOC132713695 [Ruditapes philippinarum]|uniref:uncharacterized protein LOC132713695 n=1 Tax=Ruditapes philippinarum TaxID=129788 RepID=UPI00295AEC7C|nr:uncharacterized protein LOC132713695 [Ruditapes philippinarum]